MTTALQTQSKAAAEARWASVSFDAKLDAGETLTGTPTAAEVTTSDLTLNGAAPKVSTGELVINGLRVATGRAVQFYVSGGAAGTTYTIRVTASSSSTPAQTLIIDCPLSVT